MITRVLVTGANKGIGFGIVRRILETRDDAFVFLGSRDVGRGEAAREKLADEDAGLAERVAVVELDVSRDDSVQRALETVKAAAGSAPGALYGLVNNAGIGLGSSDMETVLDVNTRGPRRVCEAFVSLIAKDGGRIVNVSSASGPMFVAKCSPERQKLLTSAEVTWAQIEALMAECLAIQEGDGSFGEAGLGDGSAYGLSKACLNAYTIELARRFPELTVNACTPGYIATDLTMSRATGRSPEEMGMKTPHEGAKAPVHLLFGDPGGSGWYFGSDAERSPLDRYRSPGDPPYTGG